MTETETDQLTKEQAIALHDDECWKDWTHRQRFEFQLHQDCLCMPFNVFHEAAEKALGRSVWTHEFAFRDDLVKEFYMDKSKPTMKEIIGLLPADKTILLVRE